MTDATTEQQQPLNKEQVYDEQISPLMLQIIDICQKRGIAMLATFAIPTPEDDGLQCTSILPDETGLNPAHHARAFQALKGSAPMLAMAITSAAKL